MNGIIRMTDFMLEPTAGTERCNRFRVTSRSHSLDDSFEFSRIDSGPIAITTEPIAIDALLIPILPLVTRRAEQKDITFVLNIMPDIPDVLSLDPAHVRRILTNLLVNAVKFTPESGGVVLHVKFERRGTHSGELRFVVADSGNGFDDSESEWLFERGGTSATPAQPSGLAVARRLARSMGGDITAWSIPEIGSSFHVVVRAQIPSERECATSSAAG